MRKLLFGAIVALVGVLAVVGVASAVDAQQAIDVKITNNKAGTKAKPKSIGMLNVVTTTTPGAGEPRRHLRHQQGDDLLRQEPRVQREGVQGVQAEQPVGARRL